MASLNFCYVAAGAGVTCFLGGVIEWIHAGGQASDIRGSETGLSLIITAAVLLVGAMLAFLLRHRIRPLDEMFDRGRHVGYEKGYREGRRAGRPTMVRMRCPHCGESLIDGQQDKEVG